MNLVDYYDTYWSRADDTFDLDRLALIAKSVRAGERVLEVDCGPGVLASMMSAR
jgi:2-polyprenyl-3-methyl-5-hydroxy-6-metoxy-1,4-benzoquinol methylase